MTKITIPQQSLVPWFRYAIIAYFARIIGNETQLGKTALQKLVFLLQEAYNVPLGYDFKFHYYGPFSSDLLGDLDYVDFLQGVSVEYEPSMGWYFIKPGPENENIIKKGDDFLKKYTSEITEVCSNFGSRTAKALELRSTLIYLSKELEREGKPSSFEELANRAKSLKPAFTLSRINRAIHDLEDKKLISLDA